MASRSDAFILVITIMATIEMTILGSSDTQNDRRISTPMVGFPLPTSSSRSTIQPTELLPTAFASAFSVVERLFYFLVGEFVIIAHFLDSYSPMA